MDQKKIDEFSIKNKVEIIFKEIIIKGIEYKEGHLNSIKKDFLDLIQNMNEQAESRIIEIPKPQFID